MLQPIHITTTVYIPTFFFTAPMCAIRPLRRCWRGSHKVRRASTASRSFSITITMERAIGAKICVGDSRRRRMREKKDRSRVRCASEESPILMALYYSRLARAGRKINTWHRRETCRLIRHSVYLRASYFRYVCYRYPWNFFSRMSTRYTMKIRCLMLGLLDEIILAVNGIWWILHIMLRSRGKRRSGICWRH